MSADRIAVSLSALALFQYATTTNYTIDRVLFGFFICIPSPYILAGGILV